MPVALDVIEFEQGGVNGIGDELPVGLLLGAERSPVGGGKALAPLEIELALGGDAGRPHVVEQGIELEFPAGRIALQQLRCVDRRENQRLIHKARGKLVKVGGSATGGHGRRLGVGVQRHQWQGE